MELRDLEKVDTSNMFREYDRWPELAIESFEKIFEKFDTKDIDHIVFAGMGGSGSIGDTISSILSKKDIHVSNVKGYLLPKTVDSKTLIIATSVSGNTSEILSILNNAKKTDAKIIGFSSGGKLESFCKNNDIFFQNIPMIHSPRVSYTSFLYSILNVLEEILPINQNDIHESISSLKNTRKNIFSQNLNIDNKSLELANFIKNIVCIFYPAGLQAPAIRFKNSLQENAKIHVISEELLESCHNGIVAWNENEIFQPILIRGKDDHTKTKERWNIIKEFFDNKNLQFFEINSVEGNILSKIINLIYVTDFATIYFSVLQNIDPSPVKAIDFVKNRLK